MVGLLLISDYNLFVAQLD